MRKMQFAALLALAASFCATGCNAPSGNDSKQDSDSVSADTIVSETKVFAVDSIGYHEKKDSTLECAISVDYPRGEDSLAVGVKNFIARELAAVYMPRERIDEEAILRKYPVYKGSVANGRQVVDYYGKGTMQYLGDCRKETEEFFVNMDDIPLLYQQVKIRKREETPTYVTYGVSDERNMGGAHGSYNFYYVNISKRTCRPVDNTVDSTRIRDIQPLLCKGILWYLEQCGVTDVTDSTLRDYIILPENGVVPLPAHTPWLENDSLNFVYQQYEIASYAMGPIGFNIAVKDIMPYVTDELKEILGRQ